MKKISKLSTKWTVFGLVLFVASMANATVLEREIFKKAEQFIDQQAPWSNAHIEMIEPSTSYPHKVPLKFVLLEGSEWTSELVTSQVREVEEIYHQCQISFGPITLIKVKNANGAEVSSKNFWPFVDIGVFSNRPLVVLSQRDFAGGISSFSIPEARQHSPATDMIFYFYENYDWSRNSVEVDPHYNILAHELAHVLFNEPHNQNWGNILCGASDCKGTKIEPAQCEKISPEFFMKPSGSKSAPKKSL